jgi:hypothetical protein
VVLLLPFAMKGQDAFLGKFINDVVDQVVDKNELKHFNYRDASFEINGGWRRYTADNLKDLPEKYHDIPLAMLNATDSTAISWSEYLGNKGKGLNEAEDKRYRLIFGVIRDTLPYDTPQKIVDSLNNLEPDRVYVPIDTSWSQKKIERVINKAVSRKLIELNYYRFSTPVFSEDKKYAVIDVEGRRGGIKYIFKYNGRRLVKVFKFSWWRYSEANFPEIN